MGEQRIYASVKDSQALFSVSPNTIYRAAKKDQITIYKAGGRSLLKISEVCDWIEGRSPTGE